MPVRLRAASRGILKELLLKKMAYRHGVLRLDVRADSPHQAAAAGAGELCAERAGAARGVHEGVELRARHGQLL
jgi:hypothetical protein